MDQMIPMWKHVYEYGTYGDLEEKFYTIFIISRFLPFCNPYMESPVVLTFAPFFDSQVFGSLDENFQNEKFH